jgi:TolA-binding protein
MRSDAPSTRSPRCARGTSRVDRVIARAHPGTARAPRVWRLGLVAAIVLGSATTLAFWGVRPSTRGGARGMETLLAGPATSAGNGRAAPRTPQRSAPKAMSTGTGPASSAAPSATAAASATRTDTGVEPRERASRVPDAAATTAASPATAEGPAALFSAANTARRTGRASQAIALYRELQQGYPSSAEASLSRVSLGRLLLARGQLDGALVQFSTYLRGGGPLEEEALLGKAKTLAALGRTGDERATWQALLRRFPRSVYAAEARERLGRDPR